MKSTLTFCQFVENFGLSLRQFSSSFISSQFIVFVIEQIFLLSNDVVASLSLFYNGVFIL